MNTRVLFCSVFVKLGQRFPGIGVIFGVEKGFFDVRFMAVIVKNHFRPLINVPDYAMFPRGVNLFLSHHDHYFPQK